MRTINGINISQLDRFKKWVEQHPEQAILNFCVSSSWDDKNKTGIEASSYSIGDVKIQKTFGPESEIVNEFFDSNDGLNPQELLIAGVNACMMVAYVVHAAARGITLERVEVETIGRIDLRGLLGVGEASQTGFKSLNYVVRIRGNANHTELKSLHREVKRTAPNYASMLQNVQMTGELVVDEG